MAVERKATRPTVDEALSRGIVVGVTRDGRLHWIERETGSPPTAHDPATAAQANLGAQVISAQERALIDANRQKIEHLKTLPYWNPDIHDVVEEIMAMANLPTLSLAAAAWVLHAVGLVPVPIFDASAAGVMAVGYVGRQLGHRLHAASVPEEATKTATQLWQTHPGIASTILLTVISRVIDSIKNAATVDDSALEAELDAYYPRWSRTDFEFDPRHYRV